MTARRLTLATLLTWPAGLLLVVANMEIDAVTPPVYVALAALYAAGVFSLLRTWDAHRDRTATVLVALAPGLFVSVGFAGPPTADEPGLMLLNTAALLIVALALLLAAIRIVVEHRASRYLGSVIPGVVLLVMGSTLYLANLVARVAVVLSGAAEQQGAVEDRAWVAFEYLRGLEGSPDFVTYLLVWLDLLQLAYLATTYVAFAAVARLLQGHGLIPERLGTGIRRGTHALSAILVLGVAAALLLPRDADLVPAWAAFVTSIPFMSTLPPFLLGVAMLRSRTAAAVPSDPLWPEPRRMVSRLGAGTPRTSTTVGDRPQ